MSTDPAHTAIVAELAPSEGDTVVDKHRYSAFARTDLADRLAEAGRDQLIVTGVYAHIGVTATALDAFQREIRPFVVADGVADLGAEQHRRALDVIASCCGVVILAGDVLDALAGGEEPSQELDGWDERIHGALAGLLSPEALSAFFADPDADLFELGLDSLRAFDFLDALADDGLDVDFGEFTRSPTLNWLRRQADSVAA